MIYLLLLLHLGLTGGTCSAYDSQTHDLGDNLVFNSDFDQPDLGSSYYMLTYGNDIPGWNCHSEGKMVNIKTMC